MHKQTVESDARHLSTRQFASRIFGQGVNNNPGAREDSNEKTPHMMLHLVRQCMMSVQRFAAKGWLSMEGMTLASIYALNQVVDKEGKQLCER